MGWRHIAKKVVGMEKRKLRNCHFYRGNDRFLIDSIKISVKEGESFLYYELTVNFVVLMVV